MCIYKLHTDEKQAENVCLALHLTNQFHYLFIHVP